MNGISAAGIDFMCSARMARVVRITNLRANASVVGTSSGFIPAQIIA